MSSQRQDQVPIADALVVTAETSRTGKPIIVLGEEVLIKISGRDTGDAFAVALGYTAPGGGPPLHRHRGQDEWWYVIEGEFLFEIDGQDLHAGPGDTVFAPRGRSHTFQNVGITPGRMLVTVVPGGLDLFFEELSAAVPPGASPDPSALAPLFEKYGMELLGPPLSARKS